MAKIAATEEQTFKVPAKPQTVYAFFTQLEKLREATPGVERCEMLPGGNVHWVLEEKADKGIRFQADFVVAYEGNGADHAQCRSVAGNMGNSWDAWIKPVPEGSEIRYRETVEPDLPITKGLALLIRPMVANELRKEVGRFLGRVRERLAN